MLNPFGAPACPDGFVEVGPGVFPGGEPVWINEVHGEYLRALAVEFELTWATGWAEDPNRLGSLLGIDRIERVPMPPIPFDPELKVPAVRGLRWRRSRRRVDRRRVRRFGAELGSNARRSHTAREH